MVDALFHIALAQLLAHEPLHHLLDPLLADDGVSGIGYGGAVEHVHAVKSGRDFGLLGEEELGFGGRHFGGRQCDVCRRRR